MTTISSLSSTSSAYSTSAAAGAGKTRRKEDDPMAKVASVLGLSNDDLHKQLDSGKSLNDIATAQGVSHDDLINAIKAGMPKSSGSASASATSSTETSATSAEAATAATAMTAATATTATTATAATDNADAVAEKIAAQVGRPPGGHHHHGGGKGVNSGLQDDSKLQQVSQLLNTSTDAVSSQATTASALVDMFKSSGVDLNKLSGVFNSGDLLDVSA